MNIISFNIFKTQNTSAAPLLQGMTQWRLLSSLAVNTNKTEVLNEETMKTDTEQSTYPAYEGYTFVRNVWNDIPD